jgi:putative DNA primase/helicase
MITLSERKMQNNEFVADGDVLGVIGVTGVTPNIHHGRSSETPEDDCVAGVTPHDFSDDESTASSKRTFKSQPPEAAINRNDRPCFRSYEGWVLIGGVKKPPGVYYHGHGKRSSTTADDGKPDDDIWICSPLTIDYQTHDIHGNNYGRLLTFTNTTGVKRHWAMPMELLAGDGTALQKELLSMGVAIAPTQRAKLFMQYLQWAPPKNTKRCVLQVGWADKSFVFPDLVIGSDDIIFQSAHRSLEAFGQRGTTEEWRDDIGSLAVGNPMLTLALCAAFAAPLLHICPAENGGIHFFGDSSTGKSTMLRAAASVWGSPEYVGSWRATANGMEGASSLRNDCLLALDEISECNPKEVGAIVYAAGNGRGKTRARASGDVKPIVTFRNFIVSTGERTISAVMEEAGDRAKAGQLVRMLDIPVGRKHGCFDELHTFASGSAMSDAIRNRSAQFYGTVGRQFVAYLVKMQETVPAHFEQIKNMPMFTPDDDHGQAKRIAQRFALLALAGEIATESGITGWNQGVATAAAEVGLSTCLSMRGKGNSETHQIIEAVTDYISTYGDSRFTHLDDENSRLKSNERSGWYEDDRDGRRHYLFHAAGFKAAHEGFDQKQVIKVLQAKGILPPASKDRKSAQVKNIRGHSQRIYDVCLGGVERELD